ncbi:MAG: hypothetical protein FJ118_18885 [Deltaproteobacteria bacterium]|nr:hypothetical protein [Deltaproteobacteria bacterium]
MDQPKRTINAKRFVEDLRSGKSPNALKIEYALTDEQLRKLIRMLVSRKLISRSEAERIEATPPPRPDTSRAESEGGGARAYEGSVRVGRSGEEPDLLSQCPQCRAQVSPSHLTCPECGHVLPGEHRWARAEPRKPLLERIPPLILGCLLAVPIGIALFVFFRYFLLPAQAIKVDQRVEQIRKEGRGKTPIETAKQGARDASLRTAQLEVDRLISEGVFLNADPDYSAFTAGPRWMQAGMDERITWLHDFASRLKNAGHKVDFEVVTPDGRVVGRATEDGVEVRAPDSPGEDPKPAGTVEIRPEAQEQLKQQFEEIIRLLPQGPPGAPPPAAR